jgi:hypothetical protein
MAGFDPKAALQNHVFCVLPAAKSDDIDVVVDIDDLADKLIAKNELFPYRARIFASLDQFYLIGSYNDQTHRALLFISFADVCPELGISMACPPRERI